MNIRTDLVDLRNAIAKMFLEFPELEEDETLRADMFEGETDLYNVIGNIVDMARDAETMAEAIKLRIDDLSGRKARFIRKEDAFRQLILDLMEKADLSKIVLPDATLSLRKIAPAPFVTDATQLPDSCIRVKREPDMKAIKEQIEQGISMAGVSMNNGKTSLTIRTK